MNQIAIRNFCVGGKEVPAVTSLQIADSFCKKPQRRFEGYPRNY